jgi:hypothetical protein
VTDTDKKFMKDVGIEPCTLEDPFPGPLCEPEQGFVLPKSLWEYLVRFPNGIREATESAAEELGLVSLSDSLDNWAQGLIQMFLDFLMLGLEDIVEMYAFPLRPIPGGCESERFHNYIRQRVRAALPVLLRDETL